MIDGIRFKVCGLTSLVDAESADECGADYLGFNLYPKSPRFIPLPQYEAMSTKLPDRRTVAVMVQPSAEELGAAKAAGFDFFQLHFGADTPMTTIAAWSERVGVERLWLAPKLPPERNVAPEWLAWAKFVLLDAFHPGVFGGSGQTGDWGKFARHRNAHPETTWVLAGGLNPENIGDALRTSGARFVDVNSGVEVAPGVKDRAKLQRFVAGIREAAAVRK